MQLVSDGSLRAGGTQGMPMVAWLHRLVGRLKEGTPYRTHAVWSYGVRMIDPCECTIPSCRRYAYGVWSMVAWQRMPSTTSSSIARGRHSVSYARRMVVWRAYDRSLANARSLRAGGTHAVWSMVEWQRMPSTTSSSIARGRHSVSYACRMVVWRAYDRSLANARSLRAGSTHAVWSMVEWQRMPSTTSSSIARGRHSVSYACRMVVWRAYDRSLRMHDPFVQVVRTQYGLWSNGNVCHRLRARRSQGEGTPYRTHAVWSYGERMVRSLANARSLRARMHVCTVDPCTYALVGKVVRSPS